MEQLSGLDAAFLYLETPNAPMHIGGLSLIDPATGSGRLDFDAFRSLLASRLPGVPAFRRRLAEVPLNLGRPYWVEDEPIDLDAHLERVRLPAPGGWEELTALTAAELSRPLPRDRPLWKVSFIEGVDTVPGAPEGAVAILGKVHHAAIDGVSGAEILGALFSPRPESPPPSAPRGGEEPAGSPEPRPGSWELLKETGKHWLGAPRAVPDAVGRVVKAVAGAGAAWALHRVQPPPMPWTAPHTVLNDPITPERSWDGVVLPLDRLKEIKNLLETTLNDVVLAVCAGALRRWLLEQGELPDDPLVAMVPVSVRGEGAGTASAGSPGSGNQVSAMLVSLATDEERPLKRLRRIHEGARASKIYLQALGARNLTDTSRFIPFSLAGLATRLYTGLHLAERHRPVFNLVITNVPGPQVPLYVGGARLLAHLGAAPVFDGMGLILPVFSYAGTLSIGITSCRSIVPDPAHLATLLRESLEELETALT